LLFFGQSQELRISFALFFSIGQICDAFGDVRICRPRNAYDDCESSQKYLDDADYGHVLELYGFPSEFRERDLHRSFAQFRDTGFEVKWVSDTSALAVFNSPESAAQALLAGSEICCLRPFSEASEEAKVKAKRVSYCLVVSNLIS
jgi:hypothetical protein